MDIFSTNVHTYIIGHYNTLVRIRTQLFTQRILCVLILDEWRNLQFNFDFESPIFLRNFSWQFYSFLEVLQERNIQIQFRSRCLVQVLNRGLMSNKPTHYLLHYGDFNLTKKKCTLNLFIFPFQEPHSNYKWTSDGNTSQQLLQKL